MEAEKVHQLVLAFLILSIITVLGAFLLGLLCMGLGFVLSIVFLLVTMADPPSFKYAKANLVILLGYYVIAIGSLMAAMAMLGVSVLGGAIGGAVFPPLAFTSFVSIPIIILLGLAQLVLPLIAIVLLGFLTLKAFHNAPCPWF